MPKQEPPSHRYVVEPGWLLTEVRGALELWREASVVIENGRITAVTRGPLEGDLPRLALEHHLMVPGFISGHTHVASGTPTRGLIESGRSYGRPIKLVDALSDAEIDDLTAANLAEVLMSGCTTQIEMSLSLRQAESYVRIAEAWGARGYPGGMVPETGRLHSIWFRDNDRTLFDSEPDTLREIAANLAFGRRAMGAGEGRIRPMMAAHATDTQTPETMRALRTAARELGTGLHMHIAQRPTETEAVRRLWSKTPVQWMEELGLFDGPVFGAHMRALDWTVDPAILNKHAAVYVHCPSAAGAGGATQPYPEALAAGMNVNIGIDTHSNDYLENLKLAVIGGRARARILSELCDVPVRHPTVLEAIDGATRVAASGLGRDDLGRIAEGARADFATIDVSGLFFGTGSLPPEPLNNLLYCNGLAVRNVATDGRFQVFDGRLMVADQDTVRAKGDAVVRKLWRQLADEDWFST